MKQTIRVIAFVFAVAGGAVFLPGRLAAQQLYPCCVKCDNGSDCKMCACGCLTGCSALGNPGIMCYSCGG